jgi:hypothetical protein
MRSLQHYLVLGTFYPNLGTPNAVTYTNTDSTQILVVPAFLPQEEPFGREPFRVERDEAAGPA